MAAHSYTLHFTGPPHSDVDDLGFECPWRGRDVDEDAERARREYAAFWKEYLPVLIRRRKRWEQADPRRHPSTLQRFVHKGVPSAMRREMWLRNCPTIPPSSSSVEESVTDAIRLDLPRTFPDNINLRTPQLRNKLGRILYGLAQHIPSIGYCQGLNFIAGLCLLVVDDERRATDLLVHLVAPRKDYYTPTMGGLSRDMRVLHQLLREHLPSVAATLDALDIGLDILVGKWFLCIFIDSLPMESVLRIWDCVIYEGDVWMFRVAIRLLRGNARALTAAKTMDTLITTIHSIGSTQNAMHCHALIKAAKNEKISQTQVDLLRQKLL